MANGTVDRARQELFRLIHRGLALGAFFETADGTLCRSVPYQGRCWLSLDPATLLPTSQFTRDTGGARLIDLAANEFLEDDFNKIAVLARATRPAAALLQATHGHPERSLRYRRVLARHGYTNGDELRIVFRTGDAVWGCAIVHRRVGVFEDREIALAADLTGVIAEGIRRAILVTALRAGDGSERPGFIILRDDGTIESATPAARQWMEEILDPTGESGEVPMVVASVAYRARLAIADGTQEVASARVPRRSGGWLELDGSLMDDDASGRIAVIIQPATSARIAPLIAAAYGLSEREREVTSLVLHGLSTADIGDRLKVSPYTVQDHLKSIFEKLGVHTRGELVAQLFYQHYARRIQSRATIGVDGWFADEPA
jgi:DNA-binding CsgD family transcriptional regulator